MPLDLVPLPLELVIFPLLGFLGLALLNLSIGIVTGLGVGPKFFLFLSLLLGYASDIGSTTLSSEMTTPLELFSKGTLGGT